MIMHPVLTLVWGVGLWHFLLGSGKQFRVLGWTFLSFFTMMLVLHGKSYYVAPIYPMLFAGGAIAWERAKWCDPRRRAWPRAALLAVIVGTGVVMAPLALPLLSREEHAAYSQKLNLPIEKEEVHHESRLHQVFSDQFGWQELVEEVAKIYYSVPAEERWKTAILAGNYGEAGAIDHFGPRYGLPSAISQHQTYYYWGTRGYTGEIVIVLQSRNREELETYFTSVEEAGRHFHEWGMAEENAPIYLCRGLRLPLVDVWRKHWN